MFQCHLSMAEVSSCINIYDGTPHSAEIKAQNDRNGEPLPKVVQANSSRVERLSRFDNTLGDLCRTMNVFYTHRKIDPPGNPSCQMKFPVGDTDPESPLWENFDSRYDIRYGGYRVSVDGLVPSDSSTPTVDVFDVECGKEYEYTVIYDEGFDYNGKWQPSGRGIVMRVAVD